MIRALIAWSTIGIALLANVPPDARAAQRDLATSAERLTIASPCARTVTIDPDPSLSAQVKIAATADHQEELSLLALDGDPSARLHITGPRCWAPSQETDFEPTLALAIRVPPAMALHIEENGGATYTLGALHGALAVDVSGGIKLHAAQAGTVMMDVSGGAVIAVGRIDGDLKADISGGGSVRVDQAMLHQLDLSIAGGGEFRIGGGDVAQARIDVSGSGLVQVGSEVGDAAVSLSGAGVVHLHHVRGQLTRDVSGAGVITTD